MRAQSFWDAAAPMIAVTESHPFLVAMVDGTLPEENFRYYVVQDALYLQDFADCLRRLASSAPTTEDSARLEAFARGAEEAEMCLHKSFFVEWDISADGAEQMPHCLLYTSYMKRVVTTRSHAQGLAVLLPCFWVYMHVGKCMLKLRDKLGDTVTRPAPYDAWIDMYAGDDFEREVEDYIAMVDSSCERIRSSQLDGEAAENDDATASATAELEEMERHFLMSCRLEHMFWDQASTCMKWQEIGGM
jgi:thiaminase/transcriptional activator TenA